MKVHIINYIYILRIILALIVENENFTLGKQIGQGNFSIVYSTQNPYYVAKVSQKNNPKAFKAYKIELDVLKTVKSDGLINLKRGGMSQLGGNEVGILIIENCPNGSLIDLLTKLPNNKPTEPLVLQVLRDVLQGLISMHKQGYIHRDVKMENVLLGSTFKLCDFGSTTKKKYQIIENSIRDDIKDEMEENTTPFYRAPEYLDLYSGFPWDERADIFALGVLQFIFSFQKPPFESQLAAINGQYFLPENHGYSSKFINLMKSMLIQDPRKRPQATDLLQQVSQWHLPLKYIQEVQKKTPDLQYMFNSVDNVYIQRKEQPLGFLDKLKRYLNTLSRTTEAWVEQCTQNDDLPPRSEDIRSLIIKAWFKREKIPKFYSAVHSKVLLPHSTNPKVILKLQILLHNYLKKGPPEAMNQQQQKIAPSMNQYIDLAIWSIIKLLIDTNRAQLQKSPKSEITLNGQYAQLLQAKLQLCFDNKSIFEASYSLTPLLSSLENGQFWKPIDSRVFDKLLDYWSTALNFAGIILKSTNLWNIQTVAIMQMVDEIYSLLSMFLHLWAQVKQTTNETEGADISKLTEWVLSIDNQFENNYLLSKQFIANISKLQEFKVIQKSLPKLPDEVITYIQNLQFLTGRSSIQINSTNAIQGIKIPVSYKVTVNNLKQQLLSLEGFDKTTPAQGDFIPDFGVFAQQDNQNNFQSWANFSLVDPNQFSKASSNVNLDLRQSNQTNIDQDLQKNITFNLQYDRSNIVQSGQFGDYPVQSEILFIQPQQSNNTSIIQKQQPDFLDLLNQEHVVQPPVEQKKPDEVDLLSFDDLPDSNVIPLDVNFNQQPVQFLTNFQQDLINLQLQQEKIQPSKEEIQLLQKFFQEEDISKYVIAFSSFIIQQQIASGASCIVHKGFHYGRFVAIKELDQTKSDENSQKEFKRETLTLIKAKQHENLVSFLGISTNNNKVYIITEFCSGGTLFDIIHRQLEINLDEIQKIKFSLDVAKGMQYLHSLGIIHRDLKSLNLLLESDNLLATKIKVADFGLSRTKLEQDSLMTAVVGTFHWMAPEVFEGQDYTAKADVYSYGIVLYEIWSREIPYKNIQNPMQIMKMVVEQQHRPELNFQCPDQIKQLIQLCWNQNPSKRPSFTNIVDLLSQI
ncbi:hypothetical protein pb186bvf_002085 [Paramecium bursaria]